MVDMEEIMTSPPHPTLIEPLCISITGGILAIKAEKKAHSNSSLP